MLPVISIQVPLSVFMDLLDYLRDYGDERDPSYIVALAIDAWLGLARGEVACNASSRGYQWKRLFLPERTEVRMLHGGSYRNAHVVGDALMYAGEAMTPSQFAAAVGGPGRNAWRDLWVRLPGERQWKKAGFHRTDLQKRDKDLPPSFRFEKPANASAAMAIGLKNALALLESAAGSRDGKMTRRTDFLVDD